MVVDIVKDPTDAGSLTRSTTQKSNLDKALAERVAFGRKCQKSSPYLSACKACYLSARKACKRGQRIAPHAAATLQIKPVTITTPSIAAGQASPA